MPCLPDRLVGSMVFAHRQGRCNWDLDLVGHTPVEEVEVWYAIREGGSCLCPEAVVAVVARRGYNVAQEEGTG